MIFSFTIGGCDSNTIFYSGNISHENNQKFFKKIKNKSVHKIIINSAGGEVEAGIDLGLWVFENKLDVEVEGRCFSSCANYVFPAGNRKIINTDAVVAWHGNYHHLEETGLWQDDIPLRMLRTGEDEGVAKQFVYTQMQKLVKMEDAFFSRINVDNKLCWVGKMQPYNVPNYYFLSVKDMAQYGVKNVDADPEYKNTDVSRFNENIQYISLEIRLLPKKRRFIH